MKDYRDVIELLKKKSVGPSEAIDIIERATTVNPENERTRWKRWRFAMYLWERVEEDKRGRLDKKINTIKKIVSTKTYKDMYSAFSLNRSFNHKREVDKLNKLVSDPRQYPYFKSSNFYYKGTKKHIPQPIIDKIR